jgi:hypothetical protein
MKTLFTAIWVIACISVLFIGHSYWNARTVVKANDEKSEISSNISSDSNTDQTKLLKMAKNWPKTAQHQFAQSLKKKTPFKILFVGSSALGSDEFGWAHDTARKLVDTYGSNVIKTDTLVYDVTSTEFVEKNDQLEMAAENAGLILFEPFLLNDNGKVGISNSLANLTKIMEDVKTANPTTTFILQPSYPLYGARHYPVQVDALKKYAEQNKIAYLDHWTAWPGTDKIELKNYLLPDLSAPNEMGNRVWKQFILDYLINK